MRQKGQEQGLCHQRGYQGYQGQDSKGKGLKWKKKTESEQGNDRAWRKANTLLIGVNLLRSTDSSIISLELKYLCLMFHY